MQGQPPAALILAATLVVIVVALELDFALGALAAGIAFVRKVGAPVRVGADGLPCSWAGVGGADYVGGVTSRRVSPVRVAAGAIAAAMVA